MVQQLIDDSFAHIYTGHSVNLYPMGSYFNRGGVAMPDGRVTGAVRLHLFAAMLVGPEWEVLPRNGLVFAGLPLVTELARLHRPGGHRPFHLSSSSRLIVSCLERLEHGVIGEGWRLKMSRVCSVCGLSTDGNTFCVSCGGSVDAVDGSWHWDDAQQDEREGHRL